MEEPVYEVLIGRTRVEEQGPTHERVGDTKQSPWSLLTADSYLVEDPLATVWIIKEVSDEAEDAGPHLASFHMLCPVFNVEVVDTSLPREGFNVFGVFE